MQFPGYWVVQQDSGVLITPTVFDETELDPASEWRTAWENTDRSAGRAGFRDLADALRHVEALLHPDRC